MMMVNDDPMLMMVSYAAKLLFHGYQVMVDNGDGIYMVDK